MNQRRMSLLTVVATCGLAVAIALSSAQAQAQADAAGARRNFVFFLVDDLGWADIGCFGSSFHETPNIDLLCQSGMKFTKAMRLAPSVRQRVPAF